MKKTRKLTKWLKVLAYFIGAIFFIYIGNIILTSVIQHKIEQALIELSPKIHNGYSSIHTNLFASTVSIKDLQIYFIPYSDVPQHQHSFYFQQVDLKGINFFRIIFNNKLNISDLTLEKAVIKVDQFLLDKKDSLQTTILDHLNIPFKNITINNLKLTEGNLWLHSDTINQLLLKGNITMFGAEILVLNKSATTGSFSLTGIKCSLSDINYPMISAHQSIHIKNLFMDSKQELLQIDSLKIISQNNNVKYDEKKADQSIGFVVKAGNIDITKFDVLQILSTSQQNKYSSKIDSDAPAISLNDFNMLIQNDQRQHHPHSFYFQHVTFKGINMSKIIFSDSIFINSVDFVQGQIKLDPTFLFKKNRLPPDVLADLHVPFKKALINSLSFSGLKVWLHSDVKNQMLLKGDLTINKAELNSLDKFRPGEFHLESFECNFSNIEYPLAGPLYMLYIKNFMVDSRKKILRIDSLKIIPRYSNFEFGKRLGHQADRVEATIAEIEISKLDVIQLIHKKLIADKVIFNNSFVYVFRDRNLLRQLKKQAMPNDYLKNLPLEVRVNTFQIKNASVVSEEFPKGGNQTGILKIEHINLQMTPVLSHPYKNDLNHSNTYIEGSIMNSGKMQASIEAPFDKNIYNIKGTITNLDLSRLNSSAENLGKFHIESGILNSLNFHFIATEEKATGEIIGEYHNLIIDRLKVKNGEKKIAQVPSFLLKHLIIPKNKDKSMDITKRTGKIDYKRDPTRLVTFYFLKTLLSGIRASFSLGFLLPQ